MVKVSSSSVLLVCLALTIVGTLLVSWSLNPYSQPDSLQQVQSRHMTVCVGNTSAERNRELDVCSFAARKRVLAQACQGGRPMGNLTGYDALPTLGAVIVNDEERVLYCRINKVGSKSAIRLFSGMNNETAGKMDVWSYNSTRMPYPDTASGYHMITRIPLQEVLSRYADYRKMVIVRHPLQRLVSAYYELVVTGRHVIGRGITDIRDFLERRVQNASMSNYHWMDYEDSCYACQVKYDYILKAETIGVDFAQLKEELDWTRNHRLRQHHPNHNFNASAIASDHLSPAFKYDELLADLQEDAPDLFQESLDKYKMDFLKYGYSWSEKHSRCIDPVNNCC